MEPGREPGYCVTYLYRPSAIKKISAGESEWAKPYSPECGADKAIGLYQTAYIAVAHVMPYDKPATLMGTERSF